MELGPAANPAPSAAGSLRRALSTSSYRPECRVLLGSCFLVLRRALPQATCPDPTRGGTDRTRSPLRRGRRFALGLRKCPFLSGVCARQCPLLGRLGCSFDSSPMDHKYLPLVRIVIAVLLLPGADVASCCALLIDRSAPSMSLLCKRCAPSHWSCKVSVRVRAARGCGEPHHAPRRLPARRTRE